MPGWLELHEMDFDGVETRNRKGVGLKRRWICSRRT